MDVIGVSLSESCTDELYADLLYIIIIHVYVVRLTVYFYLILRRWLSLANSGIFTAESFT